MEKLRTERKIDTRGRVRIPSEFRERLGIEIGDNVDLIVEGDSLRIVPLKEVNIKCINIDNYKKLQEFLQKLYSSGLIGEKYLDLLK